MQDKFTKSARNVIDKSRNIAESMGHNYIGTEHLLVSLTENKGVASKVLHENGVDSSKIRELIGDLIAPNTQIMVQEKGEYTPRAQKIIDNSIEMATKSGIAQAGTEHLLLAMLKETDCIAVRILNTKGINVQKLYVDLLTATGQDTSSAKNEYMRTKSHKGKSTTPMLDQYSRDLTAYAKDGKLDPVIGRDVEIERIIQILCRRTKNNPCLTGEPGVGKTAIVEGLAIKLANDDVPGSIMGKKLLTLDLSGMVAGSKYRGEFEEKIKRSLAEVKSSGNILLFIDEIHTIIGAGGAEGAIDAANILKPSLARGEIQLIGATTSEEYRKHIEKDTALERRFQAVSIEEPTEESTLEMLKGLAPIYEKHHNVSISSDALSAAVKMTARYVNDRFLPDKAIDAVDEACARIGIKKHIPSPELRSLEEEKVRLEDEKEKAIQSEEYEKASSIKKEQINVIKQIEEIKSKIDVDEKEEYLVTEKEIADVVSEWTKIPVNKIQEEELERLRKLEDILRERVVGQEEAVEAVSKAIRRGRTGLKDPNRPIGSFLFLGPTGVGKTELSKTLADAVFGKENDIIRVDMSEYMEKHSVSKIIGSPPGYVGYDEGGQLSEKVRKHPYSVVLFDEIEKAHPDVFNILLQILDEGNITDAQGKKVSFKNTIIIMTSNAGAQRIVEPKHLGFISHEDEETDYKQMKDAVMEEVKNIFKPEFINRIDEIMVFHMLTQENVQKIVRIMLNTLNKRTQAQMGIKLDVSDEVIVQLAKSGFDKNYGARPIRRAIQTQIEDEVSQRIIDGVIKADMNVKIGYADEKITFDVE